MSESHQACQEAACKLRIAHDMIYESPDGRVFRVLRLVCAVCGRRKMVAKQQDPASVPPSWLQDKGGMKANFWERLTSLFQGRIGDGRTLRNLLSRTNH